MDNQGKGHGSCGFDILHSSQNLIQAPRQNSSPDGKHRGACPLRHRTYARVRIGTATHNADVVCTTSTRVEMQLLPRTWQCGSCLGDTERVAMAHHLDGGAARHQMLNG
jgi:hypothetical protein